MTCTAAAQRARLTPLNPCSQGELATIDATAVGPVDAPMLEPGQHGG